METSNILGAYEHKWIGKAVSMECGKRLGIFQGIIKEISPDKITIIRAFRNGLPLRKQDAEVTLKSKDIMKIDLIPSYSGQSTLTASVINKPTPVKLPNFYAGIGSDSALNSPSTSISSNEMPTQQQEHHWTSKDNAMLMAKKLANMKICSSPNEMKSSSSSRVLEPPLNLTNDKGGIITNPSPPLPAFNNSVSQFFGNMIPPKVEVRMGSAFSACSSAGANVAISPHSKNDFNNCSRNIDIPNVRSGDNGHQRYLWNSGSYSGRNNITNGQQSMPNGFGIGSGNGNGHSSGSGNGNGNGNGKAARQQRKQLKRESSMRQQNHAFATSIDVQSLLSEDFDFEGNLALFDKKAIWNVIEAGEQKFPEQTLPTIEKKYRHDENILMNEPPQLRGIEAIFEGSSEFVTDAGLIIPTIPHFVRSKIEITADRNNLSLQRQFDILGRGATDIAILMLGGARRLTPNNCHQWPRIVIVCEKSQNYRSANIGASAGRHLASHGIEVILYLEENENIEQKNNEISLFKATGNTVVYTVNGLPTPDLVILSTNIINLPVEVKKWLGENRASIFAIDPPPSGIRDMVIKCSILPILPLNGISTENCGKLYLCNLGIPEKFYRDAGVKYKSPFGHKFVIPIHPKH